MIRTTKQTYILAFEGRAMVEKIMILITVKDEQYLSLWSWNQIITF